MTKKRKKVTLARLVDISPLSIGKKMAGTLTLTMAVDVAPRLQRIRTLTFHYAFPMT